MKKRILSLLLVLLMMVSLVPTAALATASNDYTKWKQYDSEWNQSEAWPESQYPYATMRWMRQAGCYVTSIAMLLRHYNVVTDSNVNNFNPWICNTELGKVGALDAAADMVAGNISKAYPGFVYAGSTTYSASTLVSLYNNGYACVVAVNGYGHYVAVETANSTDNIVIMDPGSESTSLSRYGSINGIIYFSVKSAGPHTHDKGQFMFYEADHPHHDCYKCSICGKVWADTNSSRLLDSCSECYPSSTVTYAVTGGNITFDKATGAITDCDTSVTEANIPSKIDGVTVTSIGIEAFRECEKLTSVTIPSTLQTIHGRAFYDCKNLTGVAIANGVTSIGQGAFTGCAGLTSVAIPNSVTSIGDGAFSSCINLKKVIIPDSIKIIDNTTFSNCTSLVSITIPNSVKSIGDRAFYNCTSLTGVTIPNGVTSIGQDAFEACTELSNVEIPNSVTSIGDSAFRGCTSLISITISNSVTSIAWYMFENCTSLMSVTIPNSVTSIGRWAFRNCTNLTSISLPDSVTEIGDSAFNGCKKLDYVYYSGSESQWNAISIDSDNAPLTSANKRYNICKYAVTGGNITFDKATGTITDCDTSVTEANIPSKIDGVTVTSIGDWAFDWCESLTNVTIPNSVTSIGQEAFRLCSSLTSIRIPNSVTSIGAYAFSQCSSLANITIPNSVTNIGDAAFAYCRSLASVTIPDSVTSIGGSVFRECTRLTSINVADTNTAYCSVNGVLFNKDKTKLIKYPAGKTAASYTIPNGVTSIASEAFAYCKSLMSITIPNSVTSTGTYVFEHCESLTSVMIPDGMTSILDSTFYCCSSLTSVTIPDSVTNICYNAFFGCKITDVYYSGSEAQWNAISIGENNNKLTSATIHYNYNNHVHNYTAVVTASTCTAAGYTVYTCSCGSSYKDNYTDALGHSYVNGACTRCGAKATDTPTPITPTGFVDVPSDAFYANAVKWAVENEITSGVGNNCFDPNGQCTRGQVVTFLWRAAGKPITKTLISFSDVQPGAYYYEAVKWAVANGITAGTDAAHFSPNATCTRGQVVTFLFRAANSPSASTFSSFSDVPATAFYYNAVNWAVENGITSGVGNNRFAPNDTCTRGQVVTFLYRAQ